MNQTNEITKDDLLNILKTIQSNIEENKEYLSKLDTEIGDGDHGFGMAEGFKSVVGKLDEFSKLDIGQLLKKSGFELIKTIGGAAGAVFGTFFTGQALYYETNLKEKDFLDLEDISNMLKEALIQIKKRGNAGAGDKTMVDALEPAINALFKGVQENMPIGKAFKNAAQKAKEGAENTKDMIGKRGRSKNLGERGKGYIDPGSMSTYFIFKSIATYFEDK